MKGLDETLCNGVKTVTKFSYLGDKLSATGGCEKAVIARTRTGWMKFGKCSEILKRQKIFINDERESLQKLCKISYVVWK